MSDEKHTMMERHLQTTIQVIIVVIILWFGAEVTNNGKALISLTTKLDIFTLQSDDHETRIREIERAKRVKGSD